VTTSAAVTQAVDGVDTIRFGPGTFDPVDTPKVLTYVGVGAGTPESATGATVIQSSTQSGTAMNLQHGGVVRSLRAVGGPGDLNHAAGTGVSFDPFDSGDMTLRVTDVIGVGGDPGPTFNYGTGLATVEESSSGTKTAIVTRGAFLSGADVLSGGLAVYTCCIQSSYTNTLMRARGGVAFYGSLHSHPTVSSTVVEGQRPRFGPRAPPCSP
jgi:hypothetical protein